LEGFGDAEEVIATAGELAGVALTGANG
jgi:hypothetical protein